MESPTDMFKYISPRKKIQALRFILQKVMQKMVNVFAILRDIEYLFTVASVKPESALIP